MSALSLFSAVGVEIEYMIVDTKRLNCRSVADRLLVDRDGEPVFKLPHGTITWSGEIVNHVLELKTSQPATSLIGLTAQFVDNVHEANRQLAKFGARLMPTGMHPWMNPSRERQLWIGDNGDIYELFDRLFQGERHGWSNIQSTHINLPFANDEEFAALHTAARVLLPILPALAASSPFADGSRSAYLDTRLAHYLTRCEAIPSVCGQIIPEVVQSEAAYQEEILDVMYRDVAADDPDDIIQADYLNARGVIPRFERSSLEIRLIDSQECPSADLAVVALTVGAMKLLVNQVHASQAQQSQLATDALRSLLDEMIRSGGATPITCTDYLALFGASNQAGIQGRDLWRRLFDEMRNDANLFPAELVPVTEQMLANDTLSQRIIDACEGNFDQAHMKLIYSKLCECLETNTLFTH